MKIKENEIMITGSDGMVGQELKSLYPNSINVTHKDFDLTKENDVKYLFYKYQPRVIIHLAARVGGVMDNIKNPAIYFDDNILMNIKELIQPKLRFIINGVAFDEVESLLGELPKNRSKMRKKIKNIMRFQFNSTSKI